MTQDPRANILLGVHPALVAKLTNQVYPFMEENGWPMRPTSGLRTLQEQQADWFKGRDENGLIVDKKLVVTHCDGIIKLSNHQARDGWGWAVDSCFAGTNDPYLKNMPDKGAAIWALFGKAVEAAGLIWGGGARFAVEHIVDDPHAELPYIAPVTLNA